MNLIEEIYRILFEDEMFSNKKSFLIYGNDEGNYQHEPDAFDIQMEDWTWRTTIWKNKEYIFIQGSANNPGIIKALNSLVREHPELSDRIINFEFGYDNSQSQTLGSFLGVAKDEYLSLENLKEMVFYHGTSSNLYDIIKKDGLKSRGDTGAEPVYGGDKAPSKPGAIYLATDLSSAKWAAKEAGKKSRIKTGDQSIRGMVLKVSGLDPRYMGPDEDSGADDALGSIKTMASISYWKPIPSQNIVDIIFI